MRSSIYCLISSSVSASIRPSTSKNWPNSRLTELRRENRRLREDVDILKRATAFSR